MYERKVQLRTVSTKERLRMREASVQKKTRSAHAQSVCALQNHENQESDPINSV